MISRVDNQKKDDYKGDLSNDKNSDLNVIAYISMPHEQIVAILKAQGKSDSDIDSAVKSVEYAKKKIRKVVNKFREKVESKYGILETAVLINRGLKYANKHNLTEIEKRIFLDGVIKGDNSDIYNERGESLYGPMSKLLGINMYNTQYLNINPKDMGKLNELNQIYQNNKYNQSNPLTR